MPLLMFVLGLLVILWPWLDRRFRDVEGSMSAMVTVPTALGVALVFLGGTLLGPWRRFAFWFGVALVGHAAALQLIEAGSALRYQHYVPPDRIVAARPLLAACLSVQAVLVLVAVARAWRPIRTWTVRNLSSWRLAAVAIVFILSSAAVSRNVAAYGVELVFASMLQVINLANVVVMVAAFPAGGLPSLLRKAGSDSKTSHARFTLVAAVFVVMVSAMLAVVVYERHPHIPDEVIYLYHARFLAAGTLTMPLPPVPAAFEIYLMQQEANRWYPSVPPGWPAMLALGVLVGAPWLVNPVLAGVNVVLTSQLLRRLYDERTTRLAVLLLCVSPWHLFMAMNFMPHTFTLSCALASAVWLARAVERRQTLPALLAGAAIGTISLIRPLDSVIVAATIGVWYLAKGFRRLTIPALAAMVLGAAMMGAVVLPYNQHLSGHPTAFPIMVYTDQHFGVKSNAYGFGPERGMGWPIDPFPGHGPIDGLINADLNTFSLNTELFGWGTGSLLLPALLLLLARPTRSDWLMVVVLVAVWIAYFFYYFSGGPDFGARYWYLMLVPLAALAARALWVLDARLGNAGLALVAVLALSAMTFINYIPWRAMDKYHHYLNMRPDIRHLAHTHHFGPSLVLIAGSEFPDYASAMAYNPIDLRAPVPIYAWDRGPDVRRALIAAYPDRPLWLVDGPSRTSLGFKVVTGPVSPTDVAVHER